MKIKSLLFALAASATAFVFANASYGQIAIFGSGNPDGFDDATSGNLLLGLRGKTYQGGLLPNIGDVYTTTTGVSPSNPARANWNIEFDVNTNLLGTGTSLVNSGYTFTLFVDTNTSTGTTFHPVNLSLIPDNSYGTNATLNGGGTTGNVAFAVGGASNNIMQNSENMMFTAFGLGTFDPNANATYTFLLQATNNAGAVVLSKSIDIQVGRGGLVAVPEPSTYALFGAGALCMIIGVKRFRSRKVTVTPAA